MSLDQTTSKPARAARWQWERRIWRFNLDASRHINSQCVSLGFCLNWNYRPAVELDLLYWTVHVEYTAA